MEEPDECDDDEDGEYTDEEGEDGAEQEYDGDAATMKPSALADQQAQSRYAYADLLVCHKCGKR